MLSRLSVAQRIYASFGAMIALLAAIVMFAYFGVNAVSQTFTDYRVAARQTLAISGFVEQLSAARLADLDYRLETSAEKAQTLADRITNLQSNDPEVMAVFDGDAETEAAIAEFAGSAQAYQAAFVEMTELQSQIDADVVQLRAVGDQLRADATAALRAVSGNFNATGSAGCQSALKFTPSSAPNIDPLVLWSGRTVGAGQGCGDGSPAGPLRLLYSLFLNRQLSLPVSTISQ
tara:strand:- start:2870 stop:3568 length:699 start_codon:yes stop_codon:yes gene_type:complete